MSSNVSTTDAKGNNNVSPAAGTSTIQLDTMSLDQLNTLKQREESRLQALSQRFSALRQAAARINAAKAAVVELYNCGTVTKSGVPADDTTNATSKDDKGDEPLPTTKDVFVPLTESVYVPGKIRMRTRRPEPPLLDTAATGDDDDDEEPLLLIELGTGYFVEQNTAATTDYLQRKLNLVNANSDNGKFSLTNPMLGHDWHTVMDDTFFGFGVSTDPFSNRKFSDIIPLHSPPVSFYGNEPIT